MQTLSAVLRTARLRIPTPKAVLRRFVLRMFTDPDFADAIVLVSAVLGAVVIAFALQPEESGREYARYMHTTVQVAK
ncbi:MAG: hypothetical protein AB3X44_16180 [Leptothrix sp. (in: b-proteobacteria)]